MAMAVCDLDVGVKLVGHGLPVGPDQPPAVF
jgi:hypothetical protein